METLSNKDKKIVKNILEELIGTFLIETNETSSVISKLADYLVENDVTFLGLNQCDQCQYGFTNELNDMICVNSESELCSEFTDFKYKCCKAFKDKNKENKV